MATVAKSGVPSPSTPSPGFEHSLVGLLAGEAIAAGDVCYVKSDATVWRSNGTAAGASALYDGVAAKAASVGEAVTLFHGITFAYGSGLTPGARYFVAATAGALSDVSTTGGTVPIAAAQDATRIYFFPPNR
jgi:hypothetical protein